MALIALLDAVCLLFFLVHLPMSILIDAQLVISPNLFPEWARAVTQSYLEDTHDPLVFGEETWLLSFVWCELLIQVPFFLLAIVCYLQRKTWIRIPAILYSAHTCTTLIPILARLLLPKIRGESVTYDLGTLLSVYGPFLVIPFLVGARWIAYDGKPFPTNQGDLREKKEA